MKKLLLSFFSAMLCIASVAQPATPDLTGLSKNPPTRISVKRHAPTGIVNAPSAKVATGQWTEWKQFCTGVFEMDDMFAAFTGMNEWQGKFPGIVVQQRQDTGDENIQQFCFKGVFNDIDLVVDYNASTRLLKVAPQEIGIDYFGMGMISAMDMATCYATIWKPGADHTQEEIDAAIAMYEPYNYFIPVLGRFYIYFGFTIPGMDDVIAISDCTLQLDGYPDFTPEIIGEKYLDSDNPEMEIKFAKEASSARYATFPGLVRQADIDAVVKGGNGISSIAQSGKIKIPAQNLNKLSNIIVITFDDKGEELEYASKIFTVVDDETTKWKSLGKTEFICDILEGTVKEVEPSVIQAEIQENIATPGLYRLVNTHGESHPLNQAGQSDTGHNHYLTFDATDPDCVLMDAHDLGVDWGGGSFVVISEASYQMSRGKTKEQVKDKAGKLADGKITFPAKGLSLWCEDWTPFDGENGALYVANESGKFSVKIPDPSAITTIDDDDNAPIEYFNLQGIRIDNPVDGLYIRRQGNRAAKIMMK